MLYEAIDYPELNSFKDVQNVRVEKGVLLNDRVAEVDWFEMKNTGDSMFREKTVYFKNPTIAKRTSTTLDIATSDSEVCMKAKSVFVKIDCQGAEIPILKGAARILEKTDFVLIEMPFFGQYNEGVPSFLEHIQFMDSIGFIPYDIFETHVKKGFMFQVDFLFIRKTHSLNETSKVDIEGRW